MHPIKFFRKKVNYFLKSIDTITTKLLTLVLFVITIPIMVILNFSQDIINQSMNDSSTNQLNLNKKIFDQKYTAEGDKLKFLAQNSIKRIINDKSSKNDVLNDLQKNNDLDFCALITRDNDFLVTIGDLSRKEISSSFNKIINVAFSGEIISSTESTADNIYKIVVSPVFNGTNNIPSVLIIGKSFDKISIPQEIKTLTTATIAFYKIINDKALILNSNNTVFESSSELPKNEFFNGMQLQNSSEYNLIIPLTNYFNETIGNAYIGISKNEFIIPGDRNIKSIGIIAVISLFVAMLIAGWFARTITNPVLALVDAAESIALGDFDHQVKIKGNDEMAQLATTFNQMSINLKKQEQIGRAHV